MQEHHKYKRRYLTNDLAMALDVIEAYNQDEASYYDDQAWVASIETVKVDASLYPNHVLDGDGEMKLYAVILHDHEGYFLGSLPMECTVCLNGDGSVASFKFA